MHDASAQAPSEPGGTSGNPRARQECLQPGACPRHQDPRGASGRDQRQALVEQVRDDERVIWVARERKQMPVSDPAKDVVLAMPDAVLNRLSQLNLALFLAALNRHLGPEEKVPGLSGVTGSQRLDTLVIAKPARDYPWLRHHKSAMAVTRHLARLLEIALHFAREGREGASIGAIFVLGHRSTLSPHLRQLILNPLKGHAQAARSIHNPDFLETLRELAAMDGAFVVNRRGIVDSAGTYLDAPVGRGDSGLVWAPGMRGAGHHHRDRRDGYRDLCLVRDRIGV